MKKKTNLTSPNNRKTVLRTHSNVMRGGKGGQNKFERMAELVALMSGKKGTKYVRKCDRDLRTLLKHCPIMPSVFMSISSPHLRRHKQALIGSGSPLLLD